MPKNPHISIIPLLAAVLALSAQAAPIQWSDAGPRVNPCGWMGAAGSQVVYVVTIVNYGDSDQLSSPGNMVSQSVSSLAGRDVAVAALYVNGDAIPFTSTEHGFTFSFFVAADDSYTLVIWLQPGCNPGRLKLEARSGATTEYPDGRPFNDLIIGPPYAQPSLALDRLAAPGPGTNAIALAVASDAEFLQLQYRDTLAPTNWTDLARVAVTGAVTAVSDTNAAPQRFYRALVPVP